MPGPATRHTLSMTQRPETPLKDLAGTLRTILRSNKAAADALVQIHEIEALAEDRLRPLLPELRVIKDDAISAARDLDTARLGELPFRLRDLALRGAATQSTATTADADADAEATPVDEPADDPDLVGGHTSRPSDRILPLAAPAAEPSADFALNSPKRVAEALFHLHELLTAGVLDQPEYDAKKRELLDRL
jgi:hypothetical protein